MTSNSIALPISAEQAAACFNEWMRRYTEEPETFEREFQTVSKFLAEEADGAEPTYGQSSTAYMREIAVALGFMSAEA